MNDETLAALERAIHHVEALAGRRHWDGNTVSSDVLDQDAALIRAHIADLQNGGERAKVVAWLNASMAYNEGTSQCRRSF